MAALKSHLLFDCVERGAAITVLYRGEGDGNGVERVFDRTWLVFSDAACGLRMIVNAPIKHPKRISIQIDNSSLEMHWKFSSVGLW